MFFDKTKMIYLESDARMASMPKISSVLLILLSMVKYNYNFKKKE